MPMSFLCQCEGFEGHLSRHGTMREQEDPTGQPSLKRGGPSIPHPLYSYWRNGWPYLKRHWTETGLYIYLYRGRKFLQVAIISRELIKCCCPMTRKKANPAIEGHFRKYANYITIIRHLQASC
jgi:hypothetical protein